MRISRIGLGLLVLSLALILGGCKDSSGGASRLVTVTDRAGNQLPNTTVVLGDSNGTMKNHGTTDANGQIAFTDPPANATVTAAASCLRSGTTQTTYSLDIKYDVNAPVTLQLNACSVFPDSSADADLGTVTVNITNAINGITQNEISTTGQQIYLIYAGIPSLITRQTITIKPSDLQAAGKLSIVVIGKDADGTSIGYGVLLDQTFTNGMTANITVDQPMSVVQYQITNMPTTVNYLCANILQMRTGKGLMITGDCHNVASAATSTVLNVPYIPGFGNQFTYSVDAVVDQNNNDGSFVSSAQYIGIADLSATSPSNQVIDLNQALTAPSNLAVSGANTNTPTLSWSTVDPGATIFWLSVGYRLTAGPFSYLMIQDLSHTRTSITFPELPDSLADFRPTGVSSFSVFTSADAGGVYRTSLGYYYRNLALAAAMREQASRKLLSSKKWGIAP